MGFDGEIQLKYHGAKVSSNGGLHAYCDLDYAQVVTSNMQCPLSCVNRYTAVLRDMKM